MALPITARPRAGLDSRRDSVAIRARLGNLPGDTVRELEFAHPTLEEVFLTYYREPTRGGEEQR